MENQQIFFCDVINLKFCSNNSRRPLLLLKKQAPSTYTGAPAAGQSPCPGPHLAPGFYEPKQPVAIAVHSQHRCDDLCAVHYTCTSLRVQLGCHLFSAYTDNPESGHSTNGCRLRLRFESVLSACREIERVVAVRYTALKWLVATRARALLVGSGVVGGMSQTHPPFMTQRFS